MEKNLPRRQFLRGEFLSSLQSDKTQIQGFQGIRPPWSKAENLFVADCSRCGDCISVCETQILIKGMGGFPEVNFALGECTFCQKCVEICLEPIFRPVMENAWEHKVSIAENCLLNQRIECRACGDYCESRAIRFKPRLGEMAELLLDLEQCNGCGACLSICPVSAVKILNILKENE